MTANELIASGWKPLTRPYTPQEGTMLARAIAQLEKGGVPYVVAEDTQEDVAGWAIFTQPRIVYGEDGE